MHRVPLIAGVFRSVDANVSNRGFVDGLKKSFADLGTDIEVSISPTTLSILKNEPALVLSNHPFIDVFSVVAALPERKNVKLIATVEFMRCAPSMDDHIIFVDTRHRKKAQKIGRVFHAFIGILNPIPRLSYSEAHQKNIDAISAASTHVNNGGLVVLFPSSNSKNGEWQQGVGHLLNATDKNRTQVVNVQVTGSLFSERLRKLPFLSFIIPKVKVTFAESYTLSEVYESDPKLITRNAENRYILWEKSLTRERYFVKRWVFNFARILDF